MTNDKWVIRAAFSWSLMVWVNNVVFPSSCRFFNLSICIYVESNKAEIDVTRLDCYLHIGHRDKTYLGYAFENVDQIRVSGKNKILSIISPARDTSNEKPIFKREKFVRRD